MEYTSASAIYYQIDSVSLAMHCKAKQAKNLKPDPTILCAEDLIILSNLSKYGHWIAYQKPGHFCWNRTAICECYFSVGPHYLIQTLLSCWKSAAATDILFGAYYICNKFFLAI